ncbi:MAG TPA: signal peptidase I [Agitococcus sp.]|nr:signal peptidase I [Agitococcus sp.]HMX98662.1 signal peptidase I [Agitococcus sp.]HNL79303.1 signal peptidase I [Agitococcus sp.]
MTELSVEQMEAVKQWRLMRVKNRLIKLCIASFICSTLYIIISQWVFLGINISKSIDGNFFVVMVGEKPKKGELVTFKAKKSLVDVIGIESWTKFICGVEGDVITHKDRSLFVNNLKVGEAAFKSRLYSKDLEMIDDGVIPKGFVFVCGTHKKSFDSRYKLVGLVDEKTFIGRAIRLY